MALTITPRISGQINTSNLSTCAYHYLYEPLLISVNNTTSTETLLRVNIDLYNTSDESLYKTYINFATYDLSYKNSVAKLDIDIMDLIKQIHSANIFKFTDVYGISDTLGYNSIVSKYKYKITFLTTSSSTYMYILPIIGARRFEQIENTLNSSSPTNEYEYYGLDMNVMKNKWGGVDIPIVSFKDPTLANANPNVNVYYNDSLQQPCGGFLIWKSRFGGWMFCGFDLETLTTKPSYSGNLVGGLYESTTDDRFGHRHVPVNYTSISESYKRTMKAFNLTNDELKAVSGITSSPAIYYVRSNGKFELMKLNSASAPYSNLTDGGDFSVSLSGISTSTIQTF